MKGELSSPDGWDRRQAARMALSDRAAEADAVHERTLLEIETAARAGDDFEPPEIACRDVERELMRYHDSVAAR